MGMQCDILVIGGGPAGMAAALSAEAAGIPHVVLAERATALGGILNQCVHTGFGLTYFGEELTGRQYGARFTSRIEASGVEVRTGTSAISLSPDGTAILSGESCGLLELSAKAVILASGCRERPIGALDIAGTRPSGIYSAGAAQKMINIGRYTIGEIFVILGSGDVGMIMARQLRQLGKTVLCVVEKESVCGGLERNRITCLEAYNIPLRTCCTISQIHGTGRLAGVTVQDLSNGREEFLACDSLITSVGLIPERELSEEASHDGSIPDWLFLCGNACFVHNTVDDVTLEAEHIGRLAAQFVITGNLQQKTEPVVSDAGRSPETGIICVACPKACPLIQTDTGYLGAVCGRHDPVPSAKNNTL